MTEGGALGVEEFLRYGREGREVVLCYRVPQSRGIVFGQRHDALCGAVAQEIRLFDAVDEGVVQDFSAGVESYELLGGPGCEVQY